METKSVSEVSTLLTEEKQEEVDKLFKYLVEGHIDIQKNLITLKCNYINGEEESQLLFRQLLLDLETSVSSCYICIKCYMSVRDLSKVEVTIKKETDYETIVQELEGFQDFSVKYMCFLSRSRNFGIESTSNKHMEYIEEKIKSSQILGETYVFKELLRKYVKQMTDSEPITASSLFSQLGILKKKHNFKGLFNVEVLLEMLVYFLVDNIDVPATSTKNDVTEEPANVQVIKMMRDSLEELIDEMKTLRMHQKTYTEDVNAIKEMSIRQTSFIEDITAIKEMLEKLK